MLEDIKDLINQLKDYGYSQSDINRIIKDIIGDINFEKITEEKANILKDSLMEYVEFAKKCKGAKI